MPLFAYDSFAGSSGTDIMDRTGQLGATYTRHPTLVFHASGNWKLSDAGRAYPLSNAYSKGIYFLSGIPSTADHDVVADWRVLSHLSDAAHGLAFRYSTTADTGYILVYQSHSTLRRWSLQRVTAGVATVLGTYALNHAIGADVAIRVELRATGIVVKIDGVARITSTDTTNQAVGRAGLYSYGIAPASYTTGMHLDRLAVTSAGAALPDYDLTGPPAATPGVASSAFTVALAAGVNPGSVAITPAIAGLAGTFVPASVALTDAIRSATFTFKPGAVGSGTISATDNLALVDPPTLAFAALYAPPAREAYWASQFPKFSDGGVAPYVAGDTNADGTGGYWLDGHDHYDPILCFMNVRDYSARKGLAVTNWDNQIAAGRIRFRDRAVRAVGNPPGEGPGVQQFHRYGTGICRLHFESTTATEVAANIEAMGHLNPTNPVLNYELQYGHTGTYREAAFILMTCLDWEWMGLGAHHLTDEAARVCLGHNVPTSVQGPTRQYGVSIKPFMVGINNAALIRYWERFRGTTDPAKAAIVAAIPGNIKGICRYMWDVCWFPAGTPVPYEGSTWDKGAISYKDLALADPLFTQIRDRPITAVGPNPRRTFRGPSTLSAVDGYYDRNLLEFTKPDGALIADRWQIHTYVGATREFTITANYPTNFDITAAHTFHIIPAAWKSFGEDGDRGAAPGMNLMALIGFAFTYWHERRVLLDEAGSGAWRARAHALFDGSSHGWNPAYNVKLFNQGTYLTFDALDYMARGDEEWPAATSYTFGAPPTGAAGAPSVASGPFRLSVPWGTRLASPTTVVPSVGAGLGSFGTPAPVLSSDIRKAVFAFTPSLAADNTAVPVSLASPLVDPAAVSYAVGAAPGGGPPASARVLLLNSAAGGILLLSRPA